MKTLTRLLLAAALVVLIVPTASAQQVMRRVEEPTPLDAKDPMAVRSAGVVKHILAGEKDLAVAAVRKEADQTYAKGDTLEKDVDAQIRRLADGKYTIKSYEVGFGSDVVVFLRNAKSEETNIVVRYNTDRKLTGFAVARLQRD